jgi:hypothetical protein
VEALAPAPSVTVALDGMTVQPLGTAGRTAKVAAAQLDASLLVTVTV